MASAPPIEAHDSAATAAILRKGRARLLALYGLLAVIALVAGIVLSSHRGGAVVPPAVTATVGNQALIETPPPDMPTPTPLANKPTPTAPAPTTAPPPAPTSAPPAAVPVVQPAPVVQSAPINANPGGQHVDDKGKGKGKPKGKD